MNINTLVYKIEGYENEIIESGFIRDIQGYITTLGQPQNVQNIILLKEIIGKVLLFLQELVDRELESDLKQVIITKGIPVFNPNIYMEKLQKLLDNPKLEANQISTELNTNLTSINTELTGISTELTRIKNVIYPYYERDKKKIEVATISINFKDEETITNFKNFSKALTKWERSIKLFQQLISSETPKDIELVNVQNGSLDVVLNINVDVAFNFAELVKYCLIAFGGFLSYKKLALPITKSYLGNKKLEELEKEKETLMLQNIGDSVKTKLIELHQEMKKHDSKINSESIDKKIDQVTNLITEHVIKGNDIELLIDYKDKTDEESLKRQGTINEIENNKLAIKKDYKELSKEDKILLLETYKIKDE